MCLLLNKNILRLNIYCNGLCLDESCLWVAGKPMEFDSMKILAFDTPRFVETKTLTLVLASQQPAMAERNRHGSFPVLTVKNLFDAIRKEF